MRPGPILLRLSFAAALAVAPAEAQQRQIFRAADWQGGALYNSNQQFGGCYIMRSYADGTKVEIQLTPRLEMWVGASKTNWNFDPNQQFELTFEINDFKRKYNGKASAQYRNTLWFNVGNDPELRRALAGNGTMTWVDPKGLRFPFDLANSDNAMRKLLACTALYGVE